MSLEGARQIVYKVKKDVLHVLKYLVCALCVGMSVYEGQIQMRETAAIQLLSSQIIADANAVSAREQVIALRNYVRSHVSWHRAQHDNRKFLRDSAVETLQMGKGYCGESTRLLVLLAEAAGIEAQRLNLWGRSPHVVAQVRLEDGLWYLADGQNPPQIPELLLLDQAMAEGRYDSYYTLNLRRLGLTRSISRLNIEMRYLTYWTENPHALSSVLWAAVLGLMMLYEGGRRALRGFLHYRGWVHSNNPERLRAALQVHESVIETSE